MGTHACACSHIRALFLSTCVFILCCTAATENTPSSQFLSSTQTQAPIRQTSASSPSASSLLGTSQPTGTSPSTQPTVADTKPSSKDMQFPFPGQELNFPAPLDAASPPPPASSSLPTQAKPNNLNTTIATSSFAPRTTTTTTTIVPTPTSTVPSTSSIQTTESTTSPIATSSKYTSALVPSTIISSLSSYISPSASSSLLPSSILAPSLANPTPKPKATITPTPTPSSASKTPPTTSLPATNPKMTSSVISTTSVAPAPPPPSSSDGTPLSIQGDTSVSSGEGVTVGSAGSIGFTYGPTAEEIIAKRRATLPAVQQCVVPTQGVYSQTRDDMVTAAKCSSKPQKSRGEAIAAATRFAPVVYFHPLEKYFPDDVLNFLDNALLYKIVNYTTYEPIGKPTERIIIDMVRNGTFLSRDSFITALSNRTSGIPSPDAAYNHSGAAFVDGISQAKMYFNVVNNTKLSNDTFIYHYYLFFPWYGCSGEQVVYQSIDQEKKYIQDMAICNYNVKEGYFSHVTVEVCRDLSTVVSVAYDAQNFVQVQDCTQGECTFQPDLDNPEVRTTNPMVFSSLYTHGMYPTRGATQIYQEVKKKMPSAVSNYYYVDRTLTDASKVFVPQDSNLVALPAQDKGLDWDSELNDNVEFKTPTWVFYQGSFGTLMDEERSMAWPVCLEKSQTQQPVNCSLELQKGFAGLLVRQHRTLATDGPNGTRFFAELRVPGGFSPYSQFYYNSYRQYIAPPAGEGEKSSVCIPSNKIVDGTPPFVTIEKQDTSVYQNRMMTGVIVLGSVGVVACVISIFAAYFAASAATAANGGKQRTRYTLDNLPVLSWFALLVTGAGYAFMVLEMSKALTYMQQITASDLWHKFDMAFMWITIIAMVLSVITIVMTSLIAGANYSRFFGFSIGSHRFVSTLQTLLTVLLLVTGLAAAAYVGFALIVAALAFSFRYACDQNKRQTVGMCLELSVFNMMDIPCGTNFDNFCYNWQNISYINILVGTGLFAIAQMLFLMVAGSNVQKLGDQLLDRLAEEHAALLEEHYSNQTGEARSSAHSSAYDSYTYDSYTGSPRLRECASHPVSPTMSYISEVSVMHAMSPTLSTRADQWRAALAPGSPSNQSLRSAVSGCSHPITQGEDEPNLVNLDSCNDVTEAGPSQLRAMTSSFHDFVGERQTELFQTQNTESPVDSTGKDKNAAPEPFNPMAWESHKYLDGGEIQSNEANKLESQSDHDVKGALQRLDTLVDKMKSDMREMGVPSSESVNFMKL